jgi:hypothetical protein
VTVEYLERVVPASGEEPEDIGTNHPMRAVTRAAALDRAWTRDHAASVGAMFDQLAPVWHTRATEGRNTALLDALERGGPYTPGLTIELGSGIGLATPTLATRFPRLVAMDLSMEMLRLAAADPPRVQADGSNLPLRDGSVAVLVLINMLLFPAEVDRVLDHGGSLVWVNTIGARTPIHLSAEDVDAALPGEWKVVASEAGWGTWCSARRASA